MMNHQLEKKFIVLIAAIWGRFTASLERATRHICRSGPRLCLRAHFARLTFSRICRSYTKANRSTDLKTSRLTKFFLRLGWDLEALLIFYYFANIFFAIINPWNLLEKWLVEKVQRVQHQSTLKFILIVRTEIKCPRPK